MRKSLLLIFISVSFYLFAQTNVYHPFPDSNTIWQEQMSGADNSIYPPCFQSDNYYLFLGGDTTIGNYTYRKVLKNATYYNGCVSPPTHTSEYYQYQCAIRQDTVQKKVFIFPGPLLQPLCSQQYSKDTLLYDFN